MADELEARVSALEVAQAVRDEQYKQILLRLEEIQNTLKAGNGYAVRFDRIEQTIKELKPEGKASIVDRVESLEDKDRDRIEAETRRARLYYATLGVLGVSAAWQVIQFLGDLLTHYGNLPRPTP